MTSKGAVSANKGGVRIIPGSVVTQSYIVEGLGNEFSYNSCSHVAHMITSRVREKPSHLKIIFLIPKELNAEWNKKYSMNRIVHRNALKK